MLQLICCDSSQLTQPERSLGWSGLHEIKMLALAFPAKSTCMQILKVAQVGHCNNMTLLYNSIRIGNMA